MLSLLSWAVVIVLFFLNKWFVGPRPAPAGVTATERPHRVLVLANQTLDSADLLDELRAIGADKDTDFHVVVPASPIETGVAATHGPLDVWEATEAGRPARLDYHPERCGRKLHRRRRTRRLPSAAGAAHRIRVVPSRSDRDFHSAAGGFGLAPLRRRRPGPRRISGSGHQHRCFPVMCRIAMTILAGFSASRQSMSADQPGEADSRGTGDTPRRGDHRTGVAAEGRPCREGVSGVRHRAGADHLNAVRSCPANRPRRCVHESSSIPTGLIELAAETRRRWWWWVHRRRVCWAGWPGQRYRPTGAHRGGSGGDRPARIPGHRVRQPATAAYGGEADVNGIIATSANWPRSGRCRCASSRSRCGRHRRSAAASRPPRTSSSNSGRAAPHDEISSNSTDVRAPLAPDVEVVVGSGPDWREAVESFAGNPATSWRWVGRRRSGRAGVPRLGRLEDPPPCARPVMIVPRHQAPA